MLAEAFERMRQYRSGEGPLDDMIASLLRDAEAPPAQVEGVGQDFIDGEDFPSSPRFSRNGRSC